MELRDNNSVKYIDVTAGSCEAYIRCDTAEAAQIFVQKSYEGRRLVVLKGKIYVFQKLKSCVMQITCSLPTLRINFPGNEEKSYWNKISEDRMEKLSKKGRIKQRGRDKLLKRAEKELGKCIKFDQD